jgi:RNA polymerase sigma factor (sigma-70 family)
LSDFVVGGAYTIETMTDDAELLAEYAQHRCEAAFKELLQRHVALVYSTALRLVSDPQWARDVVQLVFIELAQNPKTVREPRLLAGWLYRVTRRVASNLRRSEARRRQREQAAAQMNALEDTEGIWTLLAPHLDEAMDSLRARDQDLIVLRFFKGRTLRDAGEALSITEDAAQKRVSRALEQMRQFFERRGITIGGSALAGVLSANAVQPAPAGLALAIASGAGAAGAVAALAPAVKFIAMTTLQKTSFALGLTFALGIGVYQYRKHSDLLKENSRLREQVAAPVHSQPQRVASPDDSEQARQLETARLRAEVQRLRRQIAAGSNNVAQQASSQQKDTPLPLVKFSTRTSSPMKPGQTLITRAWPAENGRQTFMLLTLEHPTDGSAQQLTFRGTAFEVTDQMASSLGLQDFVTDAAGATPSALLDMDESAADNWIAEMKSTEAAKIVSRPRLITKPGDEATLFIGNSVPTGNGKYADVGRSLTLLPVTTEEGITVSVNTELTKLPDSP